MIGSRVWTRSRRRWPISASRSDKLGKLRIDQGQRIAAAENHFVDAVRSCGNRSQGRLPIGRRAWGPSA